MALSRFAYVRAFELPDPLLPATFILLRIDGLSFHRFFFFLFVTVFFLCNPVRFSDVHHFAKPNDSRALELMDHAARSLMQAYPDIVLAFGQSDEYRYLLYPQTRHPS
jgi:tRNA(His) guanylyltransferase